MLKKLEEPSATMVSSSSSSEPREDDSGGSSELKKVETSSSTTASSPIRKEEKEDPASSSFKVNNRKKHLYWALLAIGVVALGFGAGIAIKKIIDIVDSKNTNNEIIVSSATTATPTVSPPTFSPTINLTPQPTPEPTPEPTNPPTNKSTASPTEAPVAVNVTTPKPTALVSFDSPTNAPVASAGYDDGNVTATYVPGNLIKLEEGLLLSEGLTTRLIATSGQPVQYHDNTQSELNFHILPDGGATFEDTRDWNIGGWVYVSNSEAKEETPGQGGVGAITFDKNGNIIEYRMILTNTTMNCNGGR
jgi:hypothetical protein